MQWTVLCTLCTNVGNVELAKHYCAMENITFMKKHASELYTFLTSVEREIRAADVKLFLLLRGLFPSVLTQHTDWPVRGIARAPYTLLGYRNSMRSIHTGIQE